MKKSLKKAFKKIKVNFIKTHRTISFIHKEYHQSRFCIFFSIIICRIVYKTNLKEYRIFEFNKLKHKQRKTFLTTRQYKKYINDLYNKKTRYVISNRKLMNEFFRKHLGKNVLNIDGVSYKDFENFTLKAKKVIATKTDKLFSDNYKIYDLKDFRTQAWMHEKLLEDKYAIIEPYIIQNKEIDKISNSYVTVNILTHTYKKTIEVTSTILKYKDENGKIVYGNIDSKTLKLKTRLIDEDGNDVKQNISKVDLKVILPAYKQISELMLEYPFLKEMYWSFVIDSKGNAILVDAGYNYDLIFEQAGKTLKHNVGLKPYYEKILK